MLTHAGRTILISSLLLQYSGRKKNFNRNIDLGYKQGKRSTSEDGKSTLYCLEDPYNVFKNVANTPAYHRKGKMEKFARSENFGPFHVF